MRWISITLLIVLAFTMVAPLSSFSLGMTGNDCDMLTTLDVCHSSNPALSTNGKMPCVHMTVTGIIPVVFVSFRETSRPVFTELIITTRNEQPPQS